MSPSYGPKLILGVGDNREFANNIFDVRMYFPLRYMSLISMCDIIS